MWIAIAFLFLGIGVYAQVEYPASLLPLDTDTNLYTNTNPNNKRIRLPPLSNDDLMVAAAISDAVNPGPSRFAEAVEVNASVDSGEWTIINNGTVKEWRLEISSPGAITISLLFEQFHIPAMGEFYVISQNVLDLLLV